jgi:hypothetical protein
VIRIPDIVMRTIEEMVRPAIAHDVHLRNLCHLIPHMGLASRKTILGLCQTEQSAEDEDPSIYDSLMAVCFDLVKRTQDAVSAFDLFQMTIHVANYPLYRSFVSMMIRNEPLDDLSEGEEAMKSGFLAEFMAGQVRIDPKDELSYQVLDQSNYCPSAYSIYYPIAPGWSAYAKNLAVRFQTRVQQMGIIYPNVQRGKNMSQETCRMLYDDGYRCADREWKDYRTLDLEIHKYRTGREIHVPCEMRCVWRFNELKPRFYYATGGEAYWSSRYMKRVAVQLMECLSSSRENVRSHPETIEYAVSEDDYLMLWDYSAFTTSLSELKMFLYYLARNLDDTAIEDRFRVVKVNHLVNPKRSDTYTNRSLIIPRGSLTATFLLCFSTIMPQ